MSDELGSQDLKELEIILIDLNKAIEISENVYGYATFTSARLRSIRAKLIQVLNRKRGVV